MVVIPLEIPKGRPFKGGGVTFTVKTSVIETGAGGWALITGQLDETTNQGRRWRGCRTSWRASFGWSMPEGEIAPVGSWNLNGNGKGHFTIRFQFAATPPTAFQYHDLKRMAWDIPFEFHDVPLALTDMIARPRDDSGTPGVCWP